MSKSLVLVRNIESVASDLNFGEFQISRVGSSYETLRGTLSTPDVGENDWILEKTYPPVLALGNPQDVEQDLLLLRLYKAGDISFVRQVIILPNGTKLTPRPYRAINDLNSYPLKQLRYRIEPADCLSWRSFADDLRGAQSWNSDWFGIARRFFLSGGAKPFNPARDDLDRVVEYATALEATLVPEKTFNARRFRRRAAALVGLEGSAAVELSNFIKRFYEIRSQIVHGSKLGEESRRWLLDHWGAVELRVREILVNASRKLPPDEKDRRTALAKIYDPTDVDRGNFVLEKFREIKTAETRKEVADKIGQLR